MNKQALLTYLKQRRDSLQNMVDRDFGGQVSFNYMGALRELKYLLVYIEVLNRFDGDGEPEEKKVQVNLTEKQLGTLIAYMTVGVGYRDIIKEIAKKENVKHLGDVNEELKFLLGLCELMKEFVDK